MQKFIGMMTTEHKADRGIYITTSDFTEPAKRLARKHNIELWDGSKLANLLIEQRKKTQQYMEKNTQLCCSHFGFGIKILRRIILAMMLSFLRHIIFNTPKNQI